MFKTFEIKCSYIIYIYIYLHTIGIILNFKITTSINLQIIEALFCDVKNITNYVIIPRNPLFLYIYQN